MPELKIELTCPRCGNATWIRQDVGFACAECGERSFPEAMCSRVREIAPNTIRKALADWRSELDHIIDKLGTPELLAQLAEEAAELGKAALKLRRALDGKNPTPVSPADALRNVQEEMADVLLCVLSVGLDEESAERTIRAKIPRWSGRIDHDPDSDCPGYDRGFHDDAGGYHEGGCGWDPNGKFCGECSCGDCGQCPVWARDTTPGGDDDAE